MVERFKVKPDDVIVFKDGDCVHITVHCNIKPKLVKKKGTGNKINYEDWFEADCNSFTAYVDDINWEDLFDNPNLYLNFESTYKE